MTCQPDRSLPSRVASPALSLTDGRSFTPGQPVATSPTGFLRRLLTRARLPRLHPGDLSEHRLRDLGFRDGRAGPPRDKLWD
jgi:hypothetical protein